MKEPEPKVKLHTWPVLSCDHICKQDSVEQSHCTRVAVKRYRDILYIGGRQNLLSSTSFRNLSNTKNWRICFGMIGEGFEPSPPKRLVPETSALDRSAIQPIYIFIRLKKVFSFFFPLST